MRDYIESENRRWVGAWYVLPKFLATAGVCIVDDELRVEVARASLGVRMQTRKRRKVRLHKNSVEV